MIKIMKYVSHNRIHLGMDEAHDMGLGKYLEKTDIMTAIGYSASFERVYGICEKYELKPMIWAICFYAG